MTTLDDIKRENGDIKLVLDWKARKTLSKFSTEERDGIANRTITGCDTLNGAVQSLSNAAILFYEFIALIEKTPSYDTDHFFDRSKLRAYAHFLELRDLSGDSISQQFIHLKTFVVRIMQTQEETILCKDRYMNVSGVIQQDLKDYTNHYKHNYRVANKQQSADMLMDAGAFMVYLVIKFIYRIIENLLPFTSGCC